MSAINFNRSPFLAQALEFIRRNPGCSKRDVAYCDSPSLHSRTVSYRYRAINRLLDAKLVRNYDRGGRYHLLAIDGPRIADYQIVNHGIIYPDYFPGCGVFGTQFDCVATGIGDNAAEAIDDCIEQMATMAECSNIEWTEFEKRMLHDEKLRAWPRRPAVGRDDEGAFYHVSIRFNVDR